jgi:hypothetical protein
VPGVEGDDDSGVLLALSPNPFLDHVDGTTSQDSYGHKKLIIWDGRYFIRYRFE